MFKYLFPAGTLALFVGALALSAQAPQQAAPGRQPAAAPKAGVTADKDAPPKATDKSTRRRHGRVYLGVYTIPVEDMSRRVKKRLNIKEEDGVVVVEVMPDSPADEAGLKHGDVITHVNGKAVEDEDELSEDLNEMGPGKKVTLSVVRDGKKQEISAKLEEADEAPGGFAGEPGGPGGGAPMTSTAVERLRRIERLERKVSRLEKRLAEMEKGQAAK